jgi:peptidoglycan/LPS O-acetylase OafA/YrhL
VACLSVVLFHCSLSFIATPDAEARTRAGGGSWADWFVVASHRLWVGVPLFFVISGYCIAAAADSARRKPRAGATFFVRRFRRIYPPLWAYLAVTVAAVALLSLTPGYPHPIPYPWQIAPGQWLGNLTLTEEWRHTVAGPPRGYLTGQLWSLCYEEQFYLVVGLVLVAARRWLFPALAAVTALVLLNVCDLNALAGDRLGVDLNRYRWPAPGFFVDGLWLPFAAGVAVYYRSNYAGLARRWYLDGLLVVGLVWFGRYVSVGWDFEPNLPSYAGSAFAFALVLGWLHRFDAATAASRLAAPLAWCGRMCYSIYLVHVPVTEVFGWNLYRWGLDTPVEEVLVTVPVTVAASLALSYLFYRLVERRFLNSPHRPAAVTAPAGSAAAPPGPLPWACWPRGGTPAPARAS